MGGDKLGKLQSMKITAEMDIMNMKVPISTTIVQNQGFRSETTVQGHDGRAGGEWPDRLDDQSDGWEYKGRRPA